MKSNIYFHGYQIFCLTGHREFVNGCNSGQRKVTCEIPQGSILGPILILMYINDLQEVVNYCINFFADVFKMYGRVDIIA